MIKQKRKFWINAVIIILIINVGIYFYWDSQRYIVQYRGEYYEIRNEEMGVMLFEMEFNSGEFGVIRAFKKEDEKSYLVIIRDYGRGYVDVWTELEDKVITDVDSSNYDFTLYEEVSLGEIARIPIWIN